MLSKRRITPRNRHALGLLVVSAYALVCILFHPRVSIKPARDDDASDPQTNQTLSFALCNGFTNQRLAFVYGLIIAKETGRRVVWPRFLLSGIQDNASSVYAGQGNGVDFAHFYDKNAFLSFARRNGIDFVDEPEFSPSSRKRPDNRDIAALFTRRKYESVKHIELDCPLFQLSADHMSKHAAFFKECVSFLRPNKRFNALVLGARRQKLRHPYNFLHLRIEQDWIKHCGTWKIGDPSDNCFSNTLAISEHLVLKGYENSVPLYVGLDWQAVFVPLARLVIGQIKQAGYNVVLHEDVFTGRGLHREELAMLEYDLALASKKFIGNSVSTFSALIIMERQMQSQWASYYNMGDIPLAEFLPFYALPWVFTYNGDSPEYDYMLKAAVISARVNGNLKPYCIYNGSDKDDIFAWLVSNGVHVIIHKPRWTGRVAEIADAVKSLEKKSPLYISKQKITGTLQRMDIPIIRELSEHNYVLFTDADTFFLRPLSLQTFSKVIPKTLAMSFEMDDAFPCNAGVMLMNLPGLRESHRLLVEFTFSNPSLHFGPYGPLDQGALNQFYQFSMNHTCALDERFNAKPYKNGNLTDPYIIHFHGPKPHDYLMWLKTKRCSFGRKCREGVEQICKHSHLLAALAGDSQVFQELGRLCCQATYRRNCELDIDNKVP